MLTPNQLKELTSDLRSYKRKYLKKEHAELDESATRIMINSFLTSVLDYVELEEIKTEYTIKGTYADYVIQIGNTRHVIVEVKAINLNLSEKHIRQATNYAANEGIDWVLLTNGRVFNLYRVIFARPVSSKLIFSLDLSNPVDFKKCPKEFQYLHKKSVSRGKLENYWKRIQAIEPNNLCKYLYKEDFVKSLRRWVRKDSGILFTEEEVFNSIHNIIVTKIESDKPKKPKK